MKKINAFLAALTLAVTALTPLASFAFESKSDNNKTEISNEYSSHYMLTIPATLQNIDTGHTFDVGATGFLHFNEKMIVSVESENGWKLKDKEFDANDKDVAYQMSVGEKPVTAKDKDIFEVAFSDEGQSKTVTMTVDSIAAPTYAGTYGDTLTFSARAVSITPVDEAGTGGEAQSGTDEAS